MRELESVKRVEIIADGARCGPTRFVIEALARVEPSKGLFLLSVKL